MEQKCPSCASEVVHRDGTRLTSIGRRQRFICVPCKYRFTLNPFPKLKASPTMVVLAMDLYMKGLSYRSVRDTVKQFCNTDISHVTIMRWIRTGMSLLHSYVDELKPTVGDRWLADEQFLKIKTRQHFIWNCMDAKTRFLLATHLTRKKGLPEAFSLFKKAIAIADKRAHTVVTDKCYTYHAPVRKLFSTNKNPKPHRRYGLARRFGGNHKLERYHSSFRQRDKVMRGFKRKSTANQFDQNFRLYYNFIRHHQGLGMTPAQAAGLNEPASWKDLVVKAFKNKQKSIYTR